MSNIHDYLIEHAGHNWTVLLSPWAELLPEDLTLWMVNRIGDIIALFPDGSVHMLDIGAGRIERIADNRDNFISRIDQGDNAIHWLAIPLVDDCVAVGMTLAPGQCYGYKVPPLLGGDYAADNLEPTDLAVHYGFLADVYHQVKDLPDGTQVQLVVTE